MPAHAFSHPLPNAAEDVARSPYTLECKYPWPPYDWAVTRRVALEPVEALPRQIEFVRCNVNDRLLPENLVQSITFFSVDNKVEGCCKKLWYESSVNFHASHLPVILMTN